MIKLTLSPEVWPDKFLQKVDFACGQNNLLTLSLLLLLQTRNVLCGCRHHLNDNVVNHFNNNLSPHT